MATDGDFDRIAAMLRLDAQDLSTLLEVLAGKLEAALPGAVVVRRARHFLRRERPVSEVLITLGPWHFRLQAGPDGTPRAERAHTVRGIALKSEEMETADWLEALLAALAAHASSSAAAAESLQRLLT